MIKKQLTFYATWLLTLLLLFSPLTGVLTARADNVDLAGQLGGESYAVDWAGNVAYVGIGPRLVVVNVSNPANPVVERQSEPLPEVIQGVKFFGNYVYVAAGESGLYILNSAVTGVPVVGHYNTDGFAGDVDLIIGPSATRYAFVADGDNGVVALNVQNVSSPSLYDTFQVTGGTAEAVSIDTTLSEKNVYVAFGDEGLHVWRPFHQPAAESYSLAVGDYLEDVVAQDDYAYVADDGYGLRIVEWNDDSEELTEIGSGYNASSYVEGVAVNSGGSYAYLVGAGAINGGLTVVDISTKTSPTYANYTELPGYAYGVVVDDGFQNAFVADGPFGLRVVDVATLGGTGLSEKSHYTKVGHPLDIGVVGDTAYLADGPAGLKAVNMSDPAKPVLSQAFVPQVDDFLYFTGVAVTGSNVYATEETDGLVKFDINNMNASSGNLAFSDLVNDVAVSGSFAYVANDAGGLKIVDIPSLNPRGTYSVAGSEAYDVAVSGNNAYVAYGDAGLRKVDVSNPDSPAELAAYQPGGIFAEGVALYGDYVYVADSSYGLRIVNASNLSEVGTLATPGGPAGVAAAGKFYVLMADYTDGLRVIDVSDPALPVEVGFYDTAGLAVGVANGGYAYVADDEGGLWAFNALATDLEVSKSDGLEAAMYNETITYTIVVSNTGSHHADEVTVADNFPAGLSNVTWACAASTGSSCPAGGAGDIDATVDLLAGGRITFTASGVVNLQDGSALVNTASITAQAGVDSNPDNDSATDTTATTVVDLTLTKSDGQTTAVPGKTITYTITVSNSSLAEVKGAVVSDTLPADLLNPSWSCEAAANSACPSPASGNGDLYASVDVAANDGWVTFLVSGQIDPGSTDDFLTNEAAVIVPSGITDVNPDDNSAMDVSILTPQVDVEVSKRSVKTGSTITYTIAVTNAGPSATSATISDTWPSGVTGITWTCTASAGSGCPVSGTGAISASVNLLPQGTLNFVAVGTVQSPARLTSTVRVIVPDMVTELDATNNSAINDVGDIGQSLFLPIIMK